MRFQFLSLSSFLALCLCVLSAAAQNGSVNLHPGVSSRTGVPNVKVTVDQQRVPVGTQVTFTLSPASVVSDPLYTLTLFFGDRDKQVMKKAQTVHVYNAVGDYTYSILVKRNDLTPQSPALRVTLAAPSSIEVERVANFSAQVSLTDPKTEYRFVFGDTESTGWQPQPEANHAYRARGVYLAHVEVRTVGQALAVSKLHEVTVTPPQSVSVYLTLSSAQPVAGETVTLSAHVAAPRPNTQYRFDFGDGQQSFWQVEPNTQHVYKTDGRYPAFVEVTQADNNRKLSGRSAPTVIAVQKPIGPVARPTPQTNPSPGPNASSSPTDSPPNGPSSPTNSGSPVIGIASSAPSDATPTATDSPPPNRPVGPNDLWKYLLIAAVLLFLIYKASGLIFGAQPTFAAFSDPGASGLSDRKAGVPIDFQLMLRPNVSTAEYKVEAEGNTLVRNYDALSKREILEL